MTHKNTQTSDVLAYLIEHKNGITSMDAFELFGATRLSSIIYSLRKQGYDIDTIDEECKTRYGKTSQYARYVLNNGSEV